jgi:hypothetical protein
MWGEFPPVRNMKYPRLPDGGARRPSRSAGRRYLIAVEMHCIVAAMPFSMLALSSAQAIALLLDDGGVRALKDR